jgi:predicted ThiF/HesA family dinucleotide-utilizing enzyme
MHVSHIARREKMMVNSKRDGIGRLEIRVRILSLQLKVGVRIRVRVRDRVEVSESYLSQRGNGGQQ